MTSQDWRNRAACRDHDPELFFPVGTTGPALTQIEQAKAVCRRCNVHTECLQWALDSGQEAGVWGGMSENERRAVKRQHPVQPVPAQWRHCAYCGTEYPAGDPDRLYCRQRCRERATRRTRTQQRREATVAAGTEGGQAA